MLVGLGLLVLAGWGLDISVLKRIDPSLATMKANTAVLFALLGCCLYAARAHRVRTTRTIAFAIVVVATLTVFEYASAIDLHIDHLLFQDRDTLLASHAGRMSPVAAANFLLLGVALLRIDSRSRAPVAAVTLGLVAFSSFLAACGYIFGAASLYQVGPFTPMAAHTTFGFLVACAAIMSVRPRSGVMAVIVSRTAGGATLRKLLPVIVIAPLVLAWLRLLGQSAGLYDTLFGVALLTAGNVSLLALTALRTGMSLHRADLKRVDAEAVSAAVRRDLTITLNSIGDAVIATDADGLVVRMNPVAEGLTGWAMADAAGRPISDVFRIVTEGARAIVASPVARVLSEHKTVGLPDHTLLIAKDGSERPIADSAAPILDEDGAIRGAALVFRDVTAERANEMTLRANEELYRDLFENAPDMWVSADAVTRQILLCNETLATRLGYTKPELIGRLIDDLYTPASMATMRRELDRFRSDGALRDVDRELLCKDGSVVEVSLTLKAIFDEAGTPVRGRAIFHENGERKQYERDQRFLLRLTDLAGTDDKADVLLNAVCASLGEYLDVGRCFVSEINHDLGIAVSRAEMARGVPSLMSEYPLAAFSAETRADMNAGLVVVNRNVETDPRTSASAASYRAMGIGATITVPLMRSGQWVSVLGISTRGPREWASREVALVRSTAERAWLWVEKKRVEASLRASEADLLALNTELEARVLTRTIALSASLKEREVLLQEVHHRVKNNLQVISSLINMQIRQLTDPAAEAALSECRARIETIALIHAKLYQTQDYARVPFSEYARSLAANILHATGLSRSSITLDLDIGAFTLPVDRAIPCGLILNELMTNALKHAFPGERQGTLRVAMQRRFGQEMLLSVSDDGIGLPSNFSLDHLTSLGMQLVSTLVDQLDGTLEVIRGNGTSFVIVFQVESTPQSTEPVAHVA